MGVPVDSVESLGPTDIPFVCTFADFYEVDHRLFEKMEAVYKQLWHDKEGTILNYLETKRIDASVQDSKLIDIDSVQREVMERLREKGYQIPEPASKVPRVRRNSDYVNEISAVPMHFADRRGSC